TVISIGMSFLRALSVHDQADTVSPALISKITYLVNRLRDDIDAKATFARSVECGRRDLPGVKAFARIIQPENHAVGERIGFELARLPGVSAIGMSRDIARGFSGRQLQLSDDVLGERGRRKSAAEALCKLPYEPELAERARNFELGVREARNL